MLRECKSVRDGKIVHRLFVPVAVAIMVVAVIVNVDLFAIAAVSCVGMAGCDFAGTLMNVSENRGQDVYAGYGDMGGDLLGKFVLAGWSGSTLTHGHGILGWACIWPILVMGFYSTGYSTRWARRIKQSEGCEALPPTSIMGEE